MSTGVILVTGVTGLIGNAVARRLTLEGRAVVGMDRVAPADLDIPMLLHDLPDAQRWHEAIVKFGVTHVVHAGGISGPMLLQDAPGRICDINIAGLIGLLEAARIHKLRRIVWFSSVMAYGERPDLLPVPENTPLMPTTVYGATKAAGEALIRAYRAEHGVDAVSLRVTSCYGPGRTTSCLIRTLIEDGLAGRPTMVRSIPGRTRQHIFVGDVAAATRAALDARELPQAAYNIGPGRAQSLADIVDQVRVAVPSASVVMHEDGLAWNTFGLGPLLIDAARRDLLFEPATTLAAGAEQTRKWIEERQR
jgi:UDP-glucose 4-epimerase